RPEDRNLSTPGYSGNQQRDGRVQFVCGTYVCCKGSTTMKQILCVATFVVFSSVWASAQKQTIADIARQERAKRPPSQAKVVLSNKTLGIKPGTSTPGTASPAAPAAAPAPAAAATAPAAPAAASTAATKPAAPATETRD